jgi:DNA-binding NtrC family response regulator
VVERNRTRILVVDDDDHQRREAVTALRANDFQTVDTNDPELAIELAQRGDVKLDVLLTGVLMPWLNGLLLAERVLQHSPDTRVVYMLRDLAGPVHWGGLPGPVVGVVERPIDEVSLVETLHDVVEREGTESDADASGAETGDAGTQE